MTSFTKPFVLWKETVIMRVVQMLDQELFDLLEGTADAVFAVTDQCEICSWNKAVEKLFGYTKAEAIGNGC